MIILYIIATLGLSWLIFNTLDQGGVDRGWLWILSVGASLSIVRGLAWALGL